MGAAINAFKVLWNRKEEFKYVLVHLGEIHFMKENNLASFSSLINQTDNCYGLGCSAFS